MSELREVLRHWWGPWHDSDSPSGHRCPKCGNEDLWMRYIGEDDSGNYDCFRRVQCGFRQGEEHHHLGCRRCQYAWAITVEAALKEALEKDKARFRMLEMSAFCIVELTRQRRRRSLRQTTYMECPTCGGTGHIKSPETTALGIIRKLRVGLQRRDVARVDVDAEPEVANYLNNTMRSRLRELENQMAKQVLVHADPERPPGACEIHFRKQDGSLVQV